MNLGRLGTAIILVLIASWAGAENPKQVVGRVLDKKSPKNKPVGVSGVIVKAFDAQNVLLTSTTTGENGEYTLEGVEPGVFLVIEHSKTNYQRDPEPFRGIVPDGGVTVYIGRKNGDLAYYKEIGNAVIDRSTKEGVICLCPSPSPLCDPSDIDDDHTNRCSDVDYVDGVLLENEWRSIRDLDLSPEQTSSIWEQIASKVDMAQLEPLIRVDASITASEVKSLDPEAALRVAEARGFKPDVYFDFDKNEIPNSEKKKLIYTAAFLKALPSFDLVIEGHADEKGTNESNMALGDMRANTVRDFLVSNGLSADRIRTLSYGEERPVCTEIEEACSKLNRRAHFALRPRTPG